MKICHLTSAHPADDIRIFHKECVSLANSGHDVSLVTVNCAESSELGVEVVNVESNANSRISRMYKSAKLVYKKGLELDADIYHFHDPELLRFGLKLKRKGKKVIYDSHEDVPRQIMAKFWIPKLFRKIISSVFEYYENYCAKRFDAIITSTDFIKKRFLKVNKRSMEVCNYPMLSEVEVELSRSEKDNDICYVGGITQSRGILHLLDALKFVPDVKLNLAGRFSDGDEIKNKVEAHKSWCRVDFKGFVDRKGLLKIFESSKVGMVTLLPTPNHLEALPIKMFEYMGAGIPVIASDFPVWKGIIEEAKCGIAVNADDPQEIAAGIEHLLKNPNEAKRMGENGRKAILTKYNWSIEFQKLLQVYNQVNQKDNVEG